MKESVWRASIEEIPGLTAWVEAELEAVECPMRACMQIDVAIDEIFSNIAKFAYPDGNGEAGVRFDFDAESGMAELTFIDHGIPFNPLTGSDPDITLPAEQRAVGGLGILVVKKTMDGMSYRREGDTNILTIRKRLFPV